MATAHPSASFSDLFSKRTGSSLSSLAGSESLTHLFNGRAAIYQACASMHEDAGDTVLLPGFHCPTVVSPVLAANYKVKFYDIGRDLSVNIRDLSRKFGEEIAAVLVIDYFGFAEDRSEIRQLCGKNGSALIQDCSHSFLRANPLRLAGLDSDISTYSIWKLIPSLTGGAVTNGNDGYCSDRISDRQPMIDTVVQWKQLVEESINNMRDGILKSTLLGFEQWRVSRKAQAATLEFAELSADEVYPFDIGKVNFKTPWLSRHIIETSDLELICARRRSNYHLLGSQIEESAILKKVKPDLPDNICPWAYPVLLDGRDSIDKKMQSMSVPFFTFGEKLHPAIENSEQPESLVVENARYLSDRMICFSIHQDLSHSEIAEFAKVVNTTCN